MNCLRKFIDTFIKVAKPELCTFYDFENSVFHSAKNYGSVTSFSQVTS